MRNIGISNLDIYLTGRCNFECRYCYGEKDCYGPMNFEVYSKCLSFAKFIGATYIELCGGEPLTISNFEDYVLMARKSGFEVILRTNGMLIDNHLEFIANNCSWVGISIDGLSHTNSLMRPSKTPIDEEKQFTVPLNAICSLKEINPNIKIILASLASKVNYLDIPKLANYLIENKVPIDEWKIYEFIVDKFRSVDNKGLFELSEEEFSSMVKNLPETINGAKIIVKSARGERRVGDCLIVRQNGDLIIMGVRYGNLLNDDFDSIVDALFKDNAIDVIVKNKNETYGI